MNKIFSRMNVGRLFLVSAFLLMTALTSFAADPTARIRGTVTDPQGAVLPNTAVTATNQSTGVVANTVTKGDGSYEFLSLPIGIYSVAVQAPGFQSFKATGIKLDIDTNYVEPVKLTIGSTSDTVNVSADAVQVDTTNIQLSNIVGAAQIVELPLIGRNFTQLELTLPGVQASNDRFGSFSANGGQTQQSSYLINGADTNDLPLNTITFTPSLDALSEFSLITSSLNPEYSRNSGAIVSASIKNGTNRFHGNVFEFYRDTFLNTANYFQKGTSGTPQFHENLFGGTLGGPIFRDKLFFFASYQGERGRVPQAGGNGNVVYSAAQLAGNFSGTAFSSNPIPGTIKIPGCSTPGETFAQCFAGGQVPTAAFNPLAVGLVNKYVPLPNTTDGSNTFNFNSTTTQLQDQGIGRIDWAPTTKDQIYGIVIIQHAPSADGLPFTGATLPGFGETTTREVHQYTADYTHQFGATAVNDFSLHYNRFNFGAVLPANVVQPSSLGFAITSQNPSVASVPFFGVGADFSLGFSTNGPQPRLDQTYQVGDSFSKIIGKHSFKFGYDGRKFLVSNPFFANNNGSFTYTDSSSVGSGNSLVDFLLGVPDSYAQSSGSKINAYAFENYVYFQDQWKVLPSLTVTYGLGYQVDTGLHNRQFAGEGVNCFVPGVQSKVFPSAPVNLAFPGDKGCNDAQGSSTRYGDLGPRIGFAYAPDLGFLSSGPSRKLSIRAGYGIYYNRTEEEGSLQNLNQPPFALSSSGITDQGGQPSFQNPYQDIFTGQAIANPFPATFPKPGDPNVNFGNFAPFLSFSQYGPGYRPSSAQNFNLTVQRELPSSIVATVSYVGSVARHLQSTIEGNPITAAGHAACLADPNNGTGTGCADGAQRDLQSLVFTSHTANGIVAPNGLNFYPSVGLISSTGTSNYNALQVSATKAPTHGLLFQASYTYSHSLDDASNFEGSGFGGAGATAERGYNQYSPGLNYGSSSFDARHRLVISPVYEVPGLKGSGAFHEVANLLTSGWQVSGILTLASGFPVDVSYGGFGTSRSLFCSRRVTYYACPDVPNQIAPVVRFTPRTLRTEPGFNGGAAPKTAAHYLFGPSAFGTEPTGSFGNVGRNSIHGFGINNTNLVVAKNIRIPGNEALRLQLRLESDNVFNHTQFNNPTGSVVSSTFGRVRTAAPGRQSQLGVKLYF